ncbi:transmembrane protein 237 isoform X2 [Episyrphus balteatus]|uniref:transmembrane protein 237 isoform X2 n=1 Tax=Episyrphus balteatus TaxID=286459 RepID=UPI002486B623|nr:transmembrane protein 237 isoform X2 [Episyrphus balteatus]
MEATPKVHRHHHRRERRSSSRRNEHRTNQENASAERRRSEPAARTTVTTTTTEVTPTIVPPVIITTNAITNEPTTSSATTTSSTGRVVSALAAAAAAFVETSAQVSNSSTTSVVANDEPTSSSSPAIINNPEVLVNGHVVNDENDDGEEDEEKQTDKQTNNPETSSIRDTARSSIDSISLRSAIMQHSRRASPHAGLIQTQPQPHSHLHRGILGFMDRELKVGAQKKTQSLSDPQASPAQRSTRSRSSLEKSPRRKRSKSESRRRRERKLIAAGEMEVRQANETLMRYLKQCSEMNDASLSGELEIDHNYDERRVHRKTKSQRDKRGQLIRKLYTAGGLSSILKELSDDIVPADGEEIYNPFTPVVSPTEEQSTRIDKMFIQTASGYRPVDHCYYKHPIGSDPESNRPDISTSSRLACSLQRIWIMVSNICHGLLGGLALAHLLFVTTSRPLDWPDGAIHHYSSFASAYANTFYFLAIICMVSVFDRMDLCHLDFSNASEVISFRWIIIAMIYIATIILSLCAESMNEKIYVTKNSNMTLLREEMESNNQAISVWSSLSMARSIGGIFGWIMIGLSPSEDLLYGHLLDMEKYQLTNN